MASKNGISIFPSTAVLELTYRCNHNCFFCCLPWEAPNSQYPIRPELTIADWKEVADTCIADGVSVFSISGGEPTLKPHFEELIAHIRGKLGPRDHIHGFNRIHMTTNGSTLTVDHLEECRRHDVTLSISMPGLDTYEEHTGRNGIDQILEAISATASFGIHCTVAITLTRRNMHEAYEIAGRALLAGASELYLNRFLPGGRGLGHMGQLLCEKELHLALQDIDKALDQANRAAALGTEMPKCCLPLTPYKKILVSSGCAAAKQFFVIDPSGYIRVCTHSPFPLLHYSEYERLSDNQYWRDFSLSNYHPDECLACEQRSECAGGCREAAHVTQGTYRGTDPIWHRD